MTEKMNPRVKQLWVDALRSGEYEQGPGLLRLDDRYCCLGVLCELAVAEGVIPEPTRRDSGTLYGETQAASSLPSEVSDWASLSPLGYFGDDSLAWRNDEGLPFEDIATIIEEVF